MSYDRKADFERLMISRSNELMAIKDRIYYLIKDIHKGKEGRYKEAILSKIISSSLPDRYGIGTGFAICDDDEATSQIDIIIYDKHKKENNPTFLEQGDFIILESKSVEAIIEVKSTFSPNIFSQKNANGKNAIEKLLENKKRIGNRIFAGLFAFQTTYKNIHNNKALKQCLENETFIDCISFDKTHFLKFWNDTDNIPPTHPKHKHYSFYNFEKDLSFGYFISNLLEHLKVERIGRSLDEEDLKRLYVCKNGKEAYLTTHLEINSN